VTQPPPPRPSPPIEQLLARPDAERARDYRYRFGQSVVFGLPVIALEVWGRSLGGREAARWVGVLQALLSGWVLHVGAGGMLFEGLILLHARRRGTGGLAVAAVAVALYVFSAIQLGRLIFARAAGAGPVFHAVVILIASWSAWQWWRLARRSRVKSREETPGKGSSAAQAPADRT
jgi:hypothetical protein